jgi:DNA mismatch endonuclease (patch repair protein)
MSRIRGKDTKPEMIVRKWLWANGFRYRLHKKSLSGNPDIILQKYNLIIFVHGCFWHSHNCHLAATPKTRQDFWLPKLKENVKRDKRNIKKLLKDGWRVAIVWECALKGRKEFPKELAGQFMDWLVSDLSQISLSIN